ncbi:hypothetical protein [Streptomyces ossamyceticus]|uniref:J domain-containing protein n=1 Tax=Streptomyces ossamyceticus TaxID=249581 RepID=A0ABV2URP9_9ACTN
MAPGVREAFRALLAERHPDGGPGRGLDDLIASGRYVEDVYAAGRPTPTTRCGSGARLAQ